jgi:hypothetical protein
MAVERLTMRTSGSARWRPRHEFFAAVLASALRSGYALPACRCQNGILRGGAGSPLIKRDLLCGQSRPPQSLDTTNIYAEVDLETKAKALASVDVTDEFASRGPDKTLPSLMAFLKGL